MSQQATQPATQPAKFRRNLSNVSEADATDVICMLTPTSQAAFEAVKANLLVAPDHILQNDDLGGISEDLLGALEFNQSRDIALRMSSSVKSPKDGFLFGRNKTQSDVLLTPVEYDTLVSKIHFKIFVNSQGSLMLQDLSTNGTVVDDVQLKARDRRGHAHSKPATTALKNGSIICVVSGRDKPETIKMEIKMMVRIPNRGDLEDQYEDNLRKYLAERGDVAQFASMKESAYGNHWNGGALYNFTGLCGRGAFAMVYRVQTKSEGDLYAAKELDTRRFVKNGVLDLKFDSELNIMKNLKHPNIVKYVGCHHYKQWIYIIMEHVPYGELAEELKKHGKIPEADVQQVAKQILHALDYLHRRNITHRDIKPDNILIASRNPLVVKLSDFGLSKCVNDQETFLKTFCGTLLYCAPEVYPDYQKYAQGTLPKRRRQGDPASKPPPSPYDQSVDMWSFGAVIWHLLCGKPPVTGRGDDRGAQMLNNIMTKDVDFDPLRKEGISEAAIDFIARLLNRNPAMRPKEAECLDHPWLRDLPNHCDYEEDKISLPAMVPQLGDIDEDDEDLIDEDLVNDLNQMNQPISSSPDRPAKRARTFLGEPIQGQAITYPNLPEPGQSLAPPVGTVPSGQRLFGEISASVLRSSGVFGGEFDPLQSPTGMHQIRSGINDISVNDFGGQEPPASTNSQDNAGQPLQYPHVLGVPTVQATSASSLMGAEQQIGQLNMASPEADISDAATPETTNPVTPETRQLSPSASITPHPEPGVSERPQPAEEPICSREIDLGLVEDPVNFEAEIVARNASRANKLRAKAETFHGSLPERHHSPSAELAATIDARTGQVVGTTRPLDRFLPTIPPPANLTKADIDDTQFVKPPRRYGKLTSMEGSFANVIINLEARHTLWGRSPACTVRYPDKTEDRIPKIALKVFFWSPTMDSHVASGGSWTEAPGVQTLIATSAKFGIWVNGVRLRQETPDGDASLYGKLYTGDVITIHDKADGFLKLRAEITFGDGARPRPASEMGFLIQEERYHHQRMKERESMRLSMRDDQITAPAAGAAIPIVRIEAEA
jgi:serine/threonine protein kinase